MKCPLLLDGIQVVELSEAFAGPYCAMTLDDLGADAIKVERPGVRDQSRTWGPPFLGTESAYFLATNRNKRSITLNYDYPAGREILQRLLANADVFIRNQPSLASRKKRGIDPVTLRDRYPRLIYCSTSGYGHAGPNASRRGYDIVAQAETAVMSFTGAPDVEPMRFPIAIADMTTGMFATMGILAAIACSHKLPFLCFQNQQTKGAREVELAFRPPNEFFQVILLVLHSRTAGWVVNCVLKIARVRSWFRCGWSMQPTVPSEVRRKVVFPLYGLIGTARSVPLLTYCQPPPSAW